MPAAKTKNKKISKIAKTTKKSRSTHASHPGLSWKKVAAIVFVPLFAIVGLAVGLKVSYATTQQVTYNSMVSPMAEDVYGINFEDRHISELGSQVGLAGTDRMNSNVTFLMTSAACQNGTWNSGCSTAAGSTFTHPVTLNAYNVNPDNTVGDRFATVTKTFTMPYRPSSDGCGGGNTTWTGTDTQCHTSKAFTIDFSLAGITLPNNVIFGIAFNTEHEGLLPKGTPGPYNYLGVGTSGAPSVGVSLPGASDAYVAYSPAGTYCDGTPGTDTFHLDPFSFCWAGVLPSFKVSSDSVTTTPPPVIPPAPTTPKIADECKDDGWKIFTSKYKNQGQCVSAASTSK
ncbi:hypothetical protein H7Y29_02540 [Microbacteriaceae bacterium]|nr:hypothetical protein [Candidatus Saccharibacteria bacterium]